MLPYESSYPLYFWEGKQLFLTHNYNMEQYAWSNSRESPCDWHLFSKSIIYILQGVVKNTLSL